MANVTLTTDYGCSDFYTAALKIKITERLPGVTIYDISNQIQPFNILAASYQVKNSIQFFPDNTIHCIDVAFVETPVILMQYCNQYFLSSDNGIFSLILNGNKPRQLFRIKSEKMVKHNSFPAIDIFPVVIQYLANGKDLDEIASPTEELYASQSLKATILDKMIRASVIHVDSYQNAIINIGKEEFENISLGRNYIIRIRRSTEVDELMERYCDVDHGNLVAFFNANGNLELAMSNGNLAGINNLSVGDIVQIDFL